MERYRQAPGQWHFSFIQNRIEADVMVQVPLDASQSKNFGEKKVYPVLGLCLWIMIKFLLIKKIICSNPDLDLWVVYIFHAITGSFTLLELSPKLDK